MKFSYAQILPALIGANVFSEEEMVIMTKCLNMSLKELIDATSHLLREDFLTEKEDRRIELFISGKSNAEIARMEKITPSAIKHLHRKVEVLQEILFLQYMKELYPATGTFDVEKLHKYFSKSAIPRSHQVFKHLRIGLSGENPEWVVKVNKNSSLIKKSMEPIDELYPNPYLLAIDIYLALELETGPLALMTKQEAAQTEYKEKY